MGYELAKQLKEAGFSQKLKTDDLHYFHSGKDIVLGRLPDDEFPPDYDYLKVPTLSELIEACLSKICPLTQQIGIIIAANKATTVTLYNCNNEVEIITDRIPEAAIARLWIVLNT